MVTARPWLSYRRVQRVRLAPGDWRRRVYAGQYLRPSRDRDSREFFRSEDMAAHVYITPAPWHQPLDSQSWKLPMPGDTKNTDPLLWYLAHRRAATPAPPASRWGESALGWVCASALLAVFVLLVRAVEKCLDRHLFKARRRQSEEWPTPNVLATSHQQDMPPLTTPETQIDLPPPYSECAQPKSEDPPPPYSDCYVTFMNPKNGTPSARIMMPDRPGTSGEASGSQGPNTGTDAGTSNGPYRNHQNSCYTVPFAGTSSGYGGPNIGDRQNRIETIRVHGPNIGNSSTSSDFSILNEGQRI